MRTSSEVDHSKTNRSTRLFSDDSDEEINTVMPEAIPLLNPQVITLTPTTKKGTTNRRKASLPPFIHRGEDLPSSSVCQNTAGDGAELGWDETVEMLLIWTVRVLEMEARRGLGDMHNRERWEEIRRIAERMI